MITLEKLAVYKKYEGDLDLCIRNNNKKDVNIMKDDEWHLISRLLSDMHLIENNLASDEFRRKTLRFVQDNTENEEIIAALVVESGKGISIYNRVKSNSNVFSFLSSSIVKWILGFLIVRIVIYLIMN